MNYNRFLTRFFSALVIATGVCIHPLAAFDYGDLDPSKFPPSGWQEYTWDDPGGWTTINVVNNGVTRNDTTVDVAVQVENLIASGTGRRILYFPAGDYTLKTTLNINDSDIRIQGDGIDQTVFKLDFLPGKFTGISFSGNATGFPIISITAGATRGSDQVTLANAAGFDVGDFVEIADPTFTAATKGQLFIVTARAGNVLTLDMKIGTGMGANPTIQEYNPVENVSMEDCTVQRLNDGDKWSNNVVFSRAYNARALRVHSKKAVSIGINFTRVKKGLALACKASNGWTIGGGYRYGINLGTRTTQVRVSNCEAWNLRHHFIANAGANHSVFSYNTASAGYNSYGDVNVHHGNGCHNILFEGNSGREISIDNVNPTASWYITFFRNDGSSLVGSQNANSRNVNILANEMPAGGLKNQGANNYVGGNIVGGTTNWGALSSTDDIPESLYTTTQPTYVASWPLYGPPSGGSGGGANNGGTFEAESLTRNSGGATTSLNGAGTWVNLNADGAGDWVEFTLPNIAAGTYTVTVDINKFNNGGRAQTSFEGTNTGAVESWFNGSATTDPYNAGTVTVGATGNKTIRFSVTGKDGGSTGFKLAIDKIILTPGGGGGVNGGTFQAEDLTRNSGGATTGLNGAGTWVNLNADGTGDWVEFTLPNIAAGTYNLDVNINKFNNGGRAQTSVNGTNTGAVESWFNGSATTDPFDAGNVTFATTGGQTIRFSVTGKDAASTGFKLAIDSITLTP